jgi:hypothetical protein
VDQGSDAHVDRLVKELGRTIERTLAESRAVAASLERIRDAGYEIAVSVETTVAFRPDAQNVGLDLLDGAPTPTRRPPAPLKMTPLDKKFLRSLKISVGEED